MSHFNVLVLGMKKASSSVSTRTIALKASGRILRYLSPQNFQAQDRLSQLPTSHSISQFQFPSRYSHYAKTLQYFIADINPAPGATPPAMKLNSCPFSQFCHPLDSQDTALPAQKSLGSGNPPVLESPSNSQVQKELFFPKSYIAPPLPPAPFFGPNK